MYIRSQLDVAYNLDPWAKLKFLQFFFYHSMIQLTLTSQHPFQTITSQAVQSSALHHGTDYGERREVNGDTFGIFLPTASV